MQLLLSSVCLALTSAVVGNAYYQKKQFYPAVVYITKSNASMAVIYIQFFVIVFMFGKLLRRIFLGTLRAAEFEHLLERFWYAITETCLAFTVFRDDFNPRFVALFTVLLFLKSFHWLAEERVDFMERSPVLGGLFHVRVASLLAVLGGLDYMLLMHAYSSTLEKGPTVQLVFGFEYAILLTVIASTWIKYVLHTAEMRTDTPWENKAVFLLYTELVIGLIKVVLYIFFVIIMVKIYALPMFIFRPMFFTIRNFKKALSDVIMSRRAIRNMNTLYPDATPEELRLSDNICIICREDMVNHSKKLPCGHIFHTTCLRSWFQRQQTCPTCRLNILRTPTGNSTAMAAVRNGAAAAAVENANNGQNQVNAANQGGQGAAPAGQPQPGAQPGIPVQIPAAVLAAAGIPIPQSLAGAQLQDGTNIPSTSNGSINSANLLPGSAGIATENILPGSTNFNFPRFNAFDPNMRMFAPPNPFMMPPPAFPCFTPYTVPPPPMPNDLTNYSIEELKAMEGNERTSIEKRLKLLRNIDSMISAAGALMTHYQMVAPPPAVVLTPSTSSGAAGPSTSSSIPTAAPEGSLNPTENSLGVDFIGPSTSKAAATASSSSNSSNSKENPFVSSTSLLSSSSSPSSPSPASTSKKTIDKLSTVTVEDLPGDDEEVSSSSSVTSSPSKGTEGCTSLETGGASSSSSTSTPASSSDPEERSQNEIRLKRMKFLAELNRNNQSSA